LQTVTLTPDHDRILCNGIKNITDYIKNSNDVKDKYQTENIRLKTSKKIYGNLSKPTGNNLGIQGLTGSDYKILNVDCNVKSDRDPEFKIIYMYTVDTKELMASIGTIVDKKSFSTGFHFKTFLTDNGELGQVTIEPFK
jgi:hypothetical protein